MRIVYLSSIRNRTISPLSLEIKEKHMGRGRNHKLNCQCAWCDKRKDKTTNDNSIRNLESWSKERCDDELASIRNNVLIKVRRMSNDWLAVVELNKRKERIKTRLEELGYRQTRE